MMAKMETVVQGSFDEIMNRIEQGIMREVRCFFGR